MTIQTSHGKAFEFTCITALLDTLTDLGIENVSIQNDAPFLTVKHCFQEVESINKKYSVELMMAGKKLSEILLKTEPNLTSFSNTDRLILSIQPDSKGQLGDVRDFLAIRMASSHEIGWQFGVSCKHNHQAVKHPRMSPSIDFGKEWLSQPLTTSDFTNLRNIFGQVDIDRNNGKYNWNDLETQDKLDRYYKPLLEMVIQKIQEHPDQKKMSQHIISYLIGNKDFYKAIYKTNSKELIVQGFNFNGTLNLKSSMSTPLLKVDKLSLPNRVIGVGMKPDSETTLEIFFDKGWQVSMRIHNASTKLEQSLKMDVQLMGTPSIFSYSEKVSL